MSLKIYDYECRSGHITEAIGHHKQKKIDCPVCGKTAKRIISIAGQYAGNQDAPHIRSAVDALVDKDDRAPDAVTLRERPTRENLEKFMKGRGISRMDHTEHGGPPAYHPPPPVDMSGVHREVLRKHLERQRIEVR